MPHMISQLDSRGSKVYGSAPVSWSVGCSFSLSVITIHIGHNAYVYASLSVTIYYEYSRQREFLFLCLVMGRRTGSHKQTETRTGTVQQIHAYCTSWSIILTLANSNTETVHIFPTDICLQALSWTKSKTKNGKAFRQSGPKWGGAFHQAGLSAQVPLNQHHL